MIQELIVWIIIGALAGWIASMIMGTNSRQSLPMDILIGIIGAFLGGWLLGLLGIGEGANGPDFDIMSLVTAIIGALVLLFLWKQLSRRSV